MGNSFTVDTNDEMVDIDFEKTLNLHRIEKCVYIKKDYKCLYIYLNYVTYYIHNSVSNVTFIYQMENKSIYLLQMKYSKPSKFAKMNKTLSRFEF